MIDPQNQGTRLKRYKMFRNQAPDIRNIRPPR